MNLAKELEFWMTNLPNRLRLTPIIYMAIPGSHDSTTYAINKNSNISPDARNPIQYLKFLQPILRPVMIKWSKTQSVDISEQLKGGIRYFDLRIALKPDTQQFYFVHNLYSESVTPVLEQINEFLAGHPKEVIILDCQHFYNMKSADHRRFIHLLCSTFSKRILPYQVVMNHITLDHMAEKQQQVVLVYRCDEAVVEELLWPSTSFPTPWPDTVEIGQLIATLDFGVKHRDFSFGFVSQCVLTPTVWFAVKHLFSSLRKKCVLPLETEKYKWLLDQKPGHRGVNIIISDFIDFENYKFSKEVINLNQKLLL